MPQSQGPLRIGPQRRSSSLVQCVLRNLVALFSCHVDTWRCALNAQRRCCTARVQFASYAGSRSRESCERPRRHEQQCLRVNICTSWHAERVIRRKQVWGNGNGCFGLRLLTADGVDIEGGERFYQEIIADIWARGSKLRALKPNNCRGSDLGVAPPIATPLRTP